MIPLVQLFTVDNPHQTELSRYQNVSLHPARSIRKGNKVSDSSFLLQSLNKAFDDMPSLSVFLSNRKCPIVKPSILDVSSLELNLLVLLFSVVQFIQVTLQQLRLFHLKLAIERFQKESGMLRPIYL